MRRIGGCLLVMAFVACGSDSGDVGIEDQETGPDAVERDSGETPLDLGQDVFATDLPGGRDVVGTDLGGEAQGSDPGEPPRDVGEDALDGVQDPGSGLDEGPEEGGRTRG